MSVREPNGDQVRILAFDPGLSITGYACLSAGPGREVSLIEAGSIDLSPGAGEAGDSEAARWGPRLVELGRDVERLIGSSAATHAAVEAVFAHREHPRAAIAMAHARGVILRQLALAGLPVVELSAASVKKSVTGSGRASKDQVARAVSLRLGLGALPEPRDVSDAIAIGLAAAQRIPAGVRGGSGHPGGRAER